MNNKKPIGVFDSGVGGLTVLEKLVEMYPSENFIYVADQGYCPYGTKTKEEIEQRVLTIGKYLLNRGVKAIVIACNTASLFKQSLQNITDTPVISVIEPTALRAIELTKSKKVAVLATNATIQNGKYQKILEENGVEVYPVPASSFVEIIESNEMDSNYALKTVTEKLLPLKSAGVDTLIHGCTHFGLLEFQMKKVLDDVTYVECGYPTSFLLGNVLQLTIDYTSKGYIEIYTTGKKEDFEAKIKWFTIPHQPIQEL
ncbi:MAG: glutamate racemase [Bacilli bacterium]|jgi:glutamate racemase|nr:glutamate racemase [Bacilli bacterium]HHU24329.1 glutamate racemase [Acholeplasmataceae bacterium]